jgi:hypothetical protein
MLTMPETPPLPKKNQPLEYYLDYLAKLAADGNVFDRKAGYIRWLQGHAFVAAKSAKGCRATSLYEAAGVPRSTYYACVKVANAVKPAQAKKLTWTEMLAMAGYIKEPKAKGKSSKASKTLDKTPEVIAARSTPREVVDRLETDWREFADVECKTDDRDYCLDKLKGIRDGIDGLIRTWQK